MKEGDKSPSIRHGEQWTQRGGVPFKQVLKTDTFKGTYTEADSLPFWALPLFLYTHKHTYKLVEAQKGSQPIGDLNLYVVLFLLLPGASVCVCVFFLW